MTDKAQNSKPIDWSEQRFRDMLIYQRKFMWREDCIGIIAAWARMRQGMTLADIGCGLAYLGYTFWPYFGRGGRYIGIDQSMKLLQEARLGSNLWAEGGEADFIRGDAYKLPLADNSVDLIVCQTLLMHLQDPSQALQEMTRVTRPGGTVLCFEPDNLSAMMAKRYMSLPEFTSEELLLCFRVALIGNEGRIKLGRGDQNIGVRLLHMMAEQGLINLDARMSDSVWFVEPPYEGEIQQHRLKIARKNLLDEEHRAYWDDKGREEFLAGGGDPSDYERYLDLARRLKPTIEKQFDKGQFSACGTGNVYIVRGTKP